MSSAVCVICYDSSTDWTALPCGHVFHQTCLSTWMRQNPICPQCKRHPSGAQIRIYFATDDHRQTLQEAGAEAAAAAAAATTPEDPQEVEQLRQMLFMEAQEKDAAWQQVTDSEKLISRLRNTDVESRREVQRVVRELETCQMAIVQQEMNLEQVMRQLAQEQKDNQEALQQLQLANCKSDESKAMLTQQLRSAEQQNTELRNKLGVLQASEALSTARLQARQRELEEEIGRLETELSGSKWQLELELKGRELERSQMSGLLAKDSQLVEQLKQLQASYTGLRNAANEEVNKCRNLCSIANRQLEDSKREARDTMERLKKTEMQKADLARRLQASEQKFLQFQQHTLRNPGMEGGISYSQYQPDDSVLSSCNPVDQEDKHFMQQLASTSNADMVDNFANFPTFVKTVGDAEATSQARGLSGNSKLQQSTPNLLLCGQQESAEHKNCNDLQQHQQTPLQPGAKYRALQGRAASTDYINYLAFSAANPTCDAANPEEFAELQLQITEQDKRQRLDLSSKDGKSDGSSKKYSKGGKGGKCKQM